MEEHTNRTAQRYVFCRLRIHSLYAIIFVHRIIMLALEHRKFSSELVTAVVGACGRGKRNKRQDQFD
jgi:hypothetical protein